MAKKQSNEPAKPGFWLSERLFNHFGSLPHHSLENLALMREESIIFVNIGMEHWNSSANDGSSHKSRREFRARIRIEREEIESIFAVAKGQGDLCSILCP